MKKLIFSWLLSVLFISIGHAQYDNSYYRGDRTGYEGDYFSLEGALHVFKESRTLRDFERKINSKDNWVNNLDLNYDGRTDYIRVEHKRQGDFHAIILQALVDRYDVQDVAVIEIEIIRRGEAILQIVGDEDLYGEEVYVEPREGYADSRSSSRYHSNYGDYVNVYYWGPVQYILDRQYRTYNSPYYWSYYPTWWNPWRQYSWNVFRPRIVVYHNYYRVAPRHRVVRVHNFYRPYRSYCNSVVVRSNNVRVKHGKSPIYRSTPYGGQNNRSQADQRNRTTQNSRRSSGSSIYSDKSNQNSSANRNRSSSSREHDNIKTRSPQTNPNSRHYENNRERSGSTIYPRSNERNSSESRKRSETSSERDNIKNRPAEVNRNSGNSSSRSRTYETSRNDRPRVSTPSRSKTTTRSTTPTRKSTVKSSSRTSTPTPKSKASSSSSSKKSSSNTVSRSRKRSGN